MNDLEQRVREAFDEVSLPPEVRARTLAAIDDLVQPREASPSKPPAPRIVKWRRAAIALAACLVPWASQAPACTSRRRHSWAST